MRITDMILIFWQIALLGLLFFSPVTEKKIRISLAGISGGLLMAHLIIEKSHWQMIPTYMAVLISFWLLLPRRPTFAGLSQPLIKKIGLILVIISMIVPVTLFPIFQLDQPTGSFIVGTRSFQLADSMRGDRPIQLNVYYPAKSKSKKMTTYAAASSGSTAKGDLTSLLADSLVSHYDLIKTNAYLDAAPDNQCEKFPVITFSQPEDSLQRSTFQLAEMASHGFVMISINHKAETAKDRFLGSTEALKLSDSQLSNWQQDISFVLDQLTNSDQPDLVAISAITDLNRIGAMGFGSGGSAATEALIKDTRIRAGINLDGPFEKQLASETFNKPHLSLMATSKSDSTKPSQKTAEQLTDLAQLSHQKAVFSLGEQPTLTLPLANHLSFTDLAATTLLANDPAADPFDLYREINYYSLAFFDKHLQNVIVFDNRTPIIASAK